MKIDNTPQLESARLILRRYVDSDLEDMFKLYSDEEVNKYLPWYPFKSLEETQIYLHNVIYKEYEQEIAYCYAITLKTENIVIGYVVLHSINLSESTGEIGYGLAKDYWNQGIMTEATIALLSKLKDNEVKYVIATHDINNIGSGHVLEKVGMKYQYSYDETVKPKNNNITFRLYRIDF